MSHLELEKDYVKVGEIVRITSNCGDSYTSSNTKVATVAGTEITTIAPWSADIRSNWWTCPNDTVKLQVLSYEPFFEEHTMQELTIVEMVILFIFACIMFFYNLKNLV